MKINLELAKKPLNLLLIIALLLAVNSFFIGTKNIFLTTSSDLRNRVVGTRLLMAGKDPYFFHWEKGMPEEWLDPRAYPDFPVTKLTVPPTALFLNIPFVNLSYKSQIVLWYLFEWVCLIGIIIIWIKIVTSRESKKLVLIIGAIFTASFYWISHISLGQIYVFYVFLISLAFLFLQKSNKKMDIVGGFLLGLAIAMRPPYVVFLIPIIFLGKKSVIFSLLLGVLFLFVFSFTYSDLSLWKSYQSAMEIQSATVNVSGKVFQNVSYYPKVVEGLTTPEFLGYGMHDTSIKNVIQDLGFNISIKFIYISAAISILFVTFKAVRNNTNTLGLLLLGFALLLVLELHIPAARYAYYNIELLPPLFLLANRTNKLDFYLVPNLVLLAILLVGDYINPYLGMVAIWVAIFIIIKKATNIK